MSTYRNDDFFCLIGHISVFFATIDLFVSLALVELCRAQSGADLPFTENATLGQKLSLLGKLSESEVSNPVVLRRLQAELPRAQAAARERNRYIHDQWVFRPESIAVGKIGRTTLAYPLAAKPVVVEFSIADLQSFRGELGALQIVFADALKQLAPGWARR